MHNNNSGSGGRTALSVERATRLQTLAKPVLEAEQRLTYLMQFRVEDAGLFNIGAARIAVLRSWGVETAAEIDEEKVGSIPGFGRNLTERLVNWRDGLEQRFHCAGGGHGVSGTVDPSPAFLSKFALALNKTTKHREAAMLHGLASLFTGMSLAEELHTICFTAFVFVGTVCLFVGPENRVSFKCCLRRSRPRASHMLRYSCGYARAKQGPGLPRHSGLARAPKPQAHAPPHGGCGTTL